jgi:hypothetical protein
LAFFSSALLIVLEDGLFSLTIVLLLIFFEGAVFNAMEVI